MSVVEVARVTYATHQCPCVSTAAYLDVNSILLSDEPAETVMRGGGPAGTMLPCVP
eukprot:m.1515792 g.1515792  ORF g.1515792 m.1515792 type:complete len:56 (+) comp25217_c0_seq33:525-692(+)